MIDMYYKLITQTSEWTLSRVPAKYRNAVSDKLTENGYDNNGNKITP